MEMSNLSVTFYSVTSAAGSTDGGILLWFLNTFNKSMKTDTHSSGLYTFRHLRDRDIHGPVHVVPDEGDVEKEGEELARDEEEGVEEDVEDVLGEDERVEAVALVDRVLVVGLQLVERDDLRGNENYIMGEFVCQGLRDWQLEAT